MESPDLSTRSRVNDPEGWVWERVNVLFTCDEVRQTVRNVLENLIGSRAGDVNQAVITEDINSTLVPFVTNGSLLSYKINSVVQQGTGWIAKLAILPPEAVEFIGIEVEAQRQTT
jgi:hypothetical protein